MRKLIAILPALLFLAMAVFVAGCGTTEETEQQTTQTETLPPPPPVVKPVEPPVSFNQRTDTLVTAPPAVSGDPVVEQRQVATRYLVQVGAFKDAENANRIQQLTRERYAMTVLNDYNTLIGLYQIRVGSFETREAAERFRDRIVKEHPQEYKDAWIVELTQ